MKKIIFIFLIFSQILFSQIVPYIGIAQNASEKEDSESGYESMASPMGIFGIRYETQSYFIPFYNHLSSIPNTNDGNGINELGFYLEYKIDYTTLYLGRSQHKIFGESRKYDVIGNYSNIIGISKKFKSVDIFLEYRNSQNENLLYYGLILRFYGEN